MIDYFVYLIPLPHGVEGCVRTNDDDTYTIYINSNLSLERRIKALEHEREHLKENHLYSVEPVSSIEQQMPS